MDKKWCKIGFVCMVVQNGIEEPTASTPDAQRQVWKDLKKKDCKALFFLHQCVDSAHFEKIVAATTSKEAWDILAKACSGDDRLKKVKLNALKRQYELLQMEDNERICDYFTRLLRIVNQMQECGDRFKDQDLVEKAMRTLTPRFDGRVAAIEEARDLFKMKIEQLQASLEAHELKMNERSPARLQDQALYASKQKQGWKNNRVMAKKDYRKHCQGHCTCQCM